MNWKCRIGWHDWWENGSRYKTMHWVIGWWVYDRVCIRCGKCERKATENRHIQDLEFQEWKKRMEYGKKLWEDACEAHHKNYA